MIPVGFHQAQMSTHPPSNRCWQPHSSGTLVSQSRAGGLEPGIGARTPAWPFSAVCLKHYTYPLWSSIFFFPLIVKMGLINFNTVSPTVIIGVKLYITEEASFQLPQS